MWSKEKDIEMMKNPERWPQWPVLPLKTRDRKIPYPNNVACAIEHEKKGKITLMLGANLFDPNGWDKCPLEILTVEEAAEKWEVD